MSDGVRDRVATWLEVLDNSTYYELLGILEVADQSAIQQAFHSFSSNFHPDRHRGESVEVRDGVTRIYRRGTEAYGVLRNPKSRAAYDLAMTQGHLRLPAVSGPPRSETINSVDDIASLCETAAGRLHARQAARALAEKQMQEAARLFEKALLAEGNNRPLKSRIEVLISYAQGVALDE